MGVVKVAAVFVLLPIVAVVGVVAFHQYDGAEHPVSTSVSAADSSPSLVPVAASPQLSYEEQVRASQNEAMRKYPDLAQPNSAFNQIFLREYQRQRLAASKRLLDAGWPLWLADQCAARSKNRKLPPVPLEE